VGGQGKKEQGSKEVKKQHIKEWNKEMRLKKEPEVEYR
jgi:hypothetical protein